MPEASRRPETSRRPDTRDGPLPQGPLVILPPARPGDRPRRFAVRPGRVLALLAACFAAGAACSAAALALIQAGTVRGLRSELDAVRAEMEALEARLPVAGAPPEAQPPVAGTGGEAPAPGLPEPHMEIPVALLGPAEPTVRVALLRSAEDVLLQGEGIILTVGDGEPTPMPGGEARIGPARGGGISIEGLGTVREAIEIESRLGAIRVGDRSLPGRLRAACQDGALFLVDDIPMEAYVAGVVSSEMPTSWGIEAKKAQAVAARSYALMRRADGGQPFDLDATVLDQVYSGRPADAVSTAAVTATHGQVLASGGLLVSAWYSSTCAGRSELPHNVWPERPSHGTSIVSCGFCDGSPNWSWTARITPDELLRELRADGQAPSEIRSVHLRTSTVSGRVTAFEMLTDLGSLVWSGNELRRHVGWGRVRSTRFDLSFDGNAFVLAGTGFGHGVGLCQWGAHGMERTGVDYREILDHYFPGSEVVEVW